MHARNGQGGRRWVLLISVGNFSWLLGWLVV